MATAEPVVSVCLSDPTASLILRGFFRHVSYFVEKASRRCCTARLHPAVSLARPEAAMSATEGITALVWDEETMALCIVGTILAP